MAHYRSFPAPCHESPRGTYSPARPPRLRAQRAAAAVSRFLVASLAFIAICSWCRISGGAQEAEEHPADAIEVFHCDFGETWDVNYDLWPDRWARSTGSEYPHYVEIQITDVDEQGTNRALEIDLDGASASVSSPSIRVMSRFSYLMVAQLYLRGVKNSDVIFTIEFYDADGELLQTRRGRPDSLADGRHEIKLASIDPQHEAIDRAVIRLDVERLHRGDLNGKVLLEDVWLARLPRITVSSNNPFNVYKQGEEVVVRCQLSGIRERDPEIRFQLLDVSSRELHGDSVHLDGRLIVEDTKKASDIMDGIGDDSPKGYEGLTEWRPVIPGPGFYSVIVRMLSTDETGTQTEEQREMDTRVIWLAVAPDLPMPTEGDFGWALPKADEPISYPDLSRLLPMMGINWVKVPAWYNASDRQRGDDIIRFVEMLGTANVEVIGVIDRPPADSELAQRMGHEATIAEWLTSKTVDAMSALDPVMSRLSMRIRWWQLGSDQDTSFINLKEPSNQVNDLRRRLFRFGQDARLGLVWSTDDAIPVPKDASWEFQQLQPDPNFSIEEFEKFIQASRHPLLRTWVTIVPPALPKGKVATSVDIDRQATTLIRKIVAAKEHGVDGIYTPKPFDANHGLMRVDGMPAEMLLPWRTAAAMLSGAEYVGTVQLPNGSSNRNFLRPDGRVVMVVWNSEPTEEVLFLGRKIKYYDMWGRGKVPARDGHSQVIPVGPVPSFVLGVNEPVMRWRMALKFDELHVPSIFAVPHPNAIRFKNFFRQGVGGRMSIVAPQSRRTTTVEGDDPLETASLNYDRWSIDPPDGLFTLSAGEESTFPFEVRLKDAIFGKQPMRVDFVVDADEQEQYRFSVYRTMWVGTGDITIEITTHVDQDGTLVVQQYMTNNADRLVDFKCYLYAKGHRRQRAQVYRLGSTPDRTVYRFKNGESLVGQELRLEAEEISGLRVLKFRFIAKDETTPDDQPAQPIRLTAE